MNLYSRKLLSWRPRRFYQETIVQNERYKKILPFIRQYTFTSYRAEHSRRKTNHDSNENSFESLQVENFFIFFSIYG